MHLAIETYTDSLWYPRGSERLGQFIGEKHSDSFYVTPVPASGCGTRGHHGFGKSQR